MAFTKSQLEALKNALLASNQPITAPIHREFAQKIIDELYDAQSRANLLSAIQNDSSLLTTDSVFVIRNGQGFLIPSSQVGGTGSLANLTDTVIIDPQDGEVIIYNSITEKWENRVAGVVFNDFYVRHDIDNQGLDATQKSNATTNIGAQSISEKGQADGYASLDGTGRVPSSQLPSFVDDVLEFPTLGDFPTTGESGKIYIALDTNKTYRWGGTTYVEISAGVVLGETENTAYRGDRGKIAYDYSQIGHLPLAGGTLASSGSTNTLNIDHTSGSGLALNITKGGNGEGLKVVKTSGSGLAASITGGVTLLDELNLTTKLADAHIASAATWNAKIGGAIASGQVAFGTESGVIGGDSELSWDNVNKRLGVGGTPGDFKLYVNGTARVQGVMSVSNGTANAPSVYFGTDDNTGIFRSQENVFGISAGGIGWIFDSQSLRSGDVVIRRDNGNVAGSPAYSFGGNTSTGMFRVLGTTGIGFSNNGVESLRIVGTTRNILIGTPTDAGFRLDVNGTARIVGATRIDNLAGTGTRMVVADANGVMSTQALGIAGSGTLNRLAKFTAAGTVGDSQVFDNGTNVGIGTDSPTNFGNGYRTLELSGTTGGGVFRSSSNSVITEIYSDASAAVSVINVRNNNPLIFLINSSERMRITSGGNVLIGTQTDAGFRLDVNGTGRFKASAGTYAGGSLILTSSAGTNPIYLTSNGGYFALSNGGSGDHLLIASTGAATFSSSVTATAFFTSSDKRKKDIISQDGDLAIYRFKGDDQIRYGYIAQDMQALYPNQVSKGTDGMLSLNYIEILVKKVHDLETKLKRHGLD